MWWWVCDSTLSLFGHPFECPSINAQYQNPSKYQSTRIPEHSSTRTAPIFHSTHFQLLTFFCWFLVLQKWTTSGRKLQKTFTNTKNIPQVSESDQRPNQQLLLQLLPLPYIQHLTWSHSVTSGSYKWSSSGNSTDWDCFLMEFETQLWIYVPHWWYERQRPHNKLPTRPQQPPFLHQLMQPPQLPPPQTQALPHTQRQQWSSWWQLVNFTRWHRTIVRSTRDKKRWDWQGEQWRGEQQQREGEWSWAACIWDWQGIRVWDTQRLQWCKFSKLFTLTGYWAIIVCIRQFPQI